MQAIDDIDLVDVCHRLRRAFEQRAPAGYLRGKTALRNALEADLHCSELEAEILVDTLESRGLVRFDGDPAAPSEVDAPWRITS